LDVGFQAKAGKGNAIGELIFDTKGRSRRGMLRW
jgi:hypothetical protein